MKRTGSHLVDREGFSRQKSLVCLETRAVAR
jgi:hypothetical protein